MRPMPSTLTDPVGEKRDDYNAMERFFVKLIRDERDLPFVFLTFRILFIMVPIGLAMYLPIVPTWLWWGLALVYFVLNNFVYKGSFGLMLHCTSHRKWFKEKYEFANHFLPWFMGPFFGQTPETYFSHHIGMHHPENNMPEDKSSTMHYQRDSFGSFMRYFLNFLLIGLYELVEYFHTRKRKVLLRKVVTGESSFIIFCIAMSFVNFPATFMVFIFPFIVSRFIMMLGNFTQHTFIDRNDPNNAYRNSITCINVKYNHKCWNDGYHISHHVRPTMHWTEHPKFFKKTIDKYVDNKAIVFEGIGFLEVWYFVMNKKWDKLATYMVNVDNRTFENEEEAIALMKERVQRIPKLKVASAA